MGRNRFVLLPASLGGAVGRASLLLLLVAGLVGLSPAAPAAALACVWTGLGTTDDWSDAGNWAACGSGVPDSGDNVTFPATNPGGRYTVSVAGAVGGPAGMALTVEGNLYAINGAGGGLYVNSLVMTGTALTVGGGMGIDTVGTAPIVVPAGGTLVADQLRGDTAVKQGGGTLSVPGGMGGAGLVVEEGRVAVGSLVVATSITVQDGGQLELAEPGALIGNISIAGDGGGGGALRISSLMYHLGGLDVPAGATVHVEPSGVAILFSAMTGPGPLTRTGGGPVLIQDSPFPGPPPAAFTGEVRVQGGITTAGRSGPVFSGPVTIGTGTTPAALVLAQPGQLGGNPPVTVGNQGSLVVQAATSVGALEGSGAVTLGADVVLDTISPGGASFVGALVGPVTSVVRKLGTSSWDFGGILGGPTLEVHGGMTGISGSAAASPVVVRSGGILSVVGQAGPTTVEGGGTLLVPGSNQAVLGSLVMQPGAILQVALGAVPPPPPVVAQGPALVRGTLNVFALPGFGTGTYPIVSAATATDAGLVPVVPAPNTAAIAVTGGTVSLLVNGGSPTPTPVPTLTPVPTPTPAPTPVPTLTPTPAPSPGPGSPGGSTISNLPVLLRNTANLIQGW